MKKIWSLLLILIIILALIAIGYFYLYRATAPSLPTVVSRAPSTTTTSSSTTIGEFTAITVCNGGNEPNNPTNIKVMKDAVVVENISVHASDTGFGACPPTKSQDVNFDSYPDIMVATDDGSGGGAYTYWLYSTSTMQFSCPQTSGPAPNLNYCTLLNPTFDPSSKTVISTDYTSADAEDVQTYQVVDGKLVLMKDVQENK